MATQVCNTVSRLAYDAKVAVSMECDGQLCVAFVQPVTTETVGAKASISVAPDGNIYIYGMGHLSGGGNEYQECMGRWYADGERAPDGEYEFMVEGTASFYPGQHPLDPGSFNGTGVWVGIGGWWGNEIGGTCEANGAGSFPGTYAEAVLQGNLLIRRVSDQKLVAEHPIHITGTTRDGVCN